MEKKRFARNLVPFIGIIILLYVLYTNDIAEVARVFTKLQPTYILLALLVNVPILASVAIGWQLVLRKQKIFVSWMYTFKNIFIGYFYGFITPGGFGAYARALYLHSESKEPLPKCFANILIFNSIDFITLLFLGSLGGLVLSSIYPFLFLVIFTLLVTVILLFWFFLWKEKSHDFFTRLLELRMLRTIKQWFSEDVVTQLFADMPRFRSLILPFGISLAGWFIRWSAFYAIALWFDITVPYVYFILIVGLATVVAVMPVTIYGLGTRDAMMIGALGALFQTPGPQVLALTLFWFVIVLAVPSVIGAFITFCETKKLDVNLKPAENY